MIVDWTGETIAWIVLGVSTFYLADRLVIWLVTQRRARRTGDDPADNAPAV
jgi:hypothetical protein